MFNRFGAEMRKAPGSSGGRSPGPGVREKDAGDCQLLDANLDKMLRPGPKHSRWPDRWPSLRLPGQVDKVAQCRNVGAISSDARGVHGQAKSLGDSRVNPGVAEFREAEPDHRQDTVCARGRHWPRGRMPLPKALRVVKELLPIVLVPHRSPP